MIKLIRNLANCDEKFFSGWILAHAQIILQGEAEFFSNNLLNATNRKAVFKVEGRDKDGDVRQSLKVLLVMRNLLKHHRSEKCSSAVLF